MAYPHGLDLADGARVHDLFHHSEDVHIPHVKADHQPRSRSAPSLQDAVAPFDGDSQWLFAKDVLTRFQCGHGVFLVAVVGRSDGHRIHVWPGQQVSIVGGGKWLAAVRGSKCLQVVRVDVCTSDDDRPATGVVPVAPQSTPSGHADHANA